MATNFRLCYVFALGILFQLSKLSLGFNIRLKTVSAPPSVRTTIYASPSFDISSWPSFYMEKIVDGEGITSLIVLNPSHHRDLSNDKLHRHYGLLIAGSKRGVISFFNIRQFLGSFLVENERDLLESFVGML